MCVLWVPKKLVLGIISFCIFVNGVKEGVYSQHLAPLRSERPGGEKQTR